MTCSGKITATCTWVPTSANEPPPDSAIVEEDSTARGATTPAFGVSCADGLGDLPVYSSSSGFSSGTKYTVKSNPGASFTVDCSPSSTASLGSDGSYASAGVNYKATAAPAVINLTGGIGPSYAKHLLIGQQLNATLSTGPLTPISWNWTVSGGNPFKNWVAGDANAVDTPLGSETGSSLICYFAKPDTATISCTAHLAVPSGATPAGGLDVTLTQTLTVEKPSAQLDIVCGTVADLPSSTNPNDVQLQQIYNYPSSGDARGITWRGTITTPAAYITSGDYGKWNWTQLLTASRQENNGGAFWQLAVDTTPPPTVINGTQVLDGMYPYANEWYISDGTRDGNSDSPHQSLDLNNAISEYDVTDSFKDYLMYQPPGSGSLPVPLQENSWFWHFRALKSIPSTWTTNGKNAQWGYIADFPAFPVWTSYAPVGHLIYAPP